MSYTVWGAFEQFRKNTVDLAPDVSSKARTSRDYLFGQIKTLANNADFPKLKGGYLPFGSFARKTKIRPLDDIDILILIDGANTEEQPSYSEFYTYYLKAQNALAPLYLFTDEYDYVNSTCWWDSQLRRRYVNWVEIVTVLLSIFVFLIGFINGLTLEKFFLAVFLPLTPILLFGISQCRDNNDAALRLNSFKEEAENYWRQAINQKLTHQEVTQLSYKLQNSIYDNRCRNPLIFDWIYNRIRDENEEQMNKGAEDLIEELNLSINS